jgi:hypothetical protein
MTLLLAVLLIVFPVGFTALFAMLGRVFAYPAILRQPAGEVLERFTAGGTRLVLLWWAFAMTAVGFIPIAVLTGELLGDVPFAHLSVATGLAAAIVQALGLIRWPFLVPLLARERAKNPALVDLVFDVVNRYFGVAVGEHLGYALTAAWTLSVSFAVLGGTALPVWFGIIGIAIAAALLFGMLEFVGSFEEHGWPLAGSVVSIAYTAWAAWLVLAGILLLVA